jgi:rRNA maturation protein Nop10
MEKNNLKNKNTYIEAPTPNIEITNNKLTIKKCKRTPSYTFFNKKTILQCGNIESNPSSKFSLLLNHPQEHHDKQKNTFITKPPK